MAIPTPATHAAEGELRGRALAIDTYGERAVDVVERCYRRMESSLNTMRARGIVPKGAKLADAVRSNGDELPALMWMSDFHRFQEVSQQYAMEQVLTAIWFILENACCERRLMPAATIDRKNGDTIIRLIG